MTENEALDKVEVIRRDNNTMWMSILRIALRVSPDETKDILARINFNDGAVTKLLKEVAK